MVMTYVNNFKCSDILEQFGFSKKDAESVFYIFQNYFLYKSFSADFSVDFLYILTIFPFYTQF